MQIKTNLNLEWGWFWLNLGWYGGEPLTLFSLGVCEVAEDFRKKERNLVSIFYIQILRFLFAFGWQP